LQKPSGNGNGASCDNLSDLVLYMVVIPQLAVELSPDIAPGFKPIDSG
jgi:hypothetical protein